MCIICVSKSGVAQPSEKTIRTMFRNNPHGAGYMYARNGIVTIHKGFMDVESYLDALKSECFTSEDSVVYHFRISTQAGVTPEMTHPFPLTRQKPLTRKLDLACGCGIAHNGIIRITTDPNNKRYSDTAIFITDFLADIIRKPSDLRNQNKLDTIYMLARSKFAIMDKGGYIATVGDFVEEDGLLYSNTSYLPRIFALK